MSIEKSNEINWAEPPILDPIREHVFPLLLLADLLRCARVCKSWYEIARDETYYKNFINKANERFFSYIPSDRFLTCSTRETFLLNLKEMTSDYPKNMNVSDCLRDRWIHKMTSKWGYGRDEKRMSEHDILSNCEKLYAVAYAFYTSDRSKLPCYKEDCKIYKNGKITIDLWPMYHRHETAARIVAFAGDDILVQKALACAKKALYYQPEHNEAKKCTVKKISPRDANIALTQLPANVATMAILGKRENVGKVVGSFHYEDFRSFLQFKASLPKLDPEIMKNIASRLDTLVDGFRHNFIATEKPMASLNNKRTAAEIETKKDAPDSKKAKIDFSIDDKLT